MVQTFTTLRKAPHQGFSAVVARPTHVLENKDTRHPPPGPRILFLSKTCVFLLPSLNVQVFTPPDAPVFTPPLPLVLPVAWCASARCASLYLSFGRRRRNPALPSGRIEVSSRVEADEKPLYNQLSHRDSSLRTFAVLHHRPVCTQYTRAHTA